MLEHSGFYRVTGKKEASLIAIMRILFKQKIKKIEQFCSLCNNESIHFNSVTLSND